MVNFMSLEREHKTAKENNLAWINEWRKGMGFQAWPLSQAKDLNLMLLFNSPSDINSGTIQCFGAQRSPLLLCYISS